MSGPRSLHVPAAALAVALALALVLAPVAGLPSVGAPAPSSDAPSSPTQSADPGTDSGADRTSRIPVTVPPADLREPVRSERNTTAYLTLAADLETRRTGTATFDVGGAMAADSSATHSTYETTWLRAAFEAAGDNRTQRRLVVERGADRLDARIEALEDREARALERYNEGEISTRTYLRELATIDQAARSLRESVDLLYTYSSAVGEPVTDRRIAAQKARLLPLVGPVRSRTAAAMRGDKQPTRVYVETSSQGVVLATIDRGPFTQEYLREAYVPSARNPDGIDQFERSGDRLGAARQRAAELYPWAFDRGPTSAGSFTGEPFLFNAGVYSVQVGHPHGTSRTHDLLIFLDGATRDVFHEIQYKDLSAVPTVFASANASQGINVSINRTRTGGPMLVTVRNTTTGEPVEAQLLVDGEPVGTTAVDGQRWIIAPGPTVQVTAVSGERNVTATVFSDGAPTG